jgi:glycerate kinase
VRVVVAPDKFAGTLTAPEAAAAIAAGWRRRCPDDEVVAAPMADGGPGFVDTLHAALGGELGAVSVAGPFGAPTPAELLLVPPAAGSHPTAYLESAQACGLALLPAGPDGRPEPGVAEAASTLGVGQLVAAAVAAGARKVVLGLGGSGTNDGGAGLLAGLGAVGDPPDALCRGALGLPDLAAVDVAPARAALAGVELVGAADVDNPLLGLRGAINVYGPQKGLPRDRLIAADGALTTFAHLVGRPPADTPGAGAAGGLGYAVLVLGGRLVGGLDTVAAAVGLDAAVAGADLVLTGEGALDWQSLRGKVVGGVARRANAVGAPCVALAGRVDMGLRELRNGGIEAAYGLVDAVGKEQAMAHPAEALADLAERVARTWGRPGRS